MHLLQCCLLLTALCWETPHITFRCYATANFVSPTLPSLFVSLLLFSWYFDCRCKCLSKRKLNYVNDKRCLTVAFPLTQACSLRLLFGCDACALSCLSLSLYVYVCTPLCSGTVTSRRLQRCKQKLIFFNTHTHTAALLRSLTVMLSLHWRWGDPTRCCSAESEFSYFRSFEASGTRVGRRQPKNAKQFHDESSSASEENEKRAKKKTKTKYWLTNILNKIGLENYKLAGRQSK